MYPDWKSHPPTTPPDNKIRREGQMISLTDIRGLIPTMIDPVIWSFSLPGRQSVANAARLAPISVPIGGFCSHDQEEDCDRESCSWDVGGTDLTMLTAHDLGGLFACHRVAFDYMMTHDTFRLWCEAVVEATFAQGSWDDLDYDLTCRLIVMAVNGRMVPADAARLAAEQHARRVRNSTVFPATAAKMAPVDLATSRVAKVREIKPEVARRIATYFVQAENGGLVKIGKSNNIRSRLTTLQTGSPVRLAIIGAIRGDREAELHLRFKGLRSHGEWFKPNAALLLLVETEGEKWEGVDLWCSGKEEPS
jgi:hypothetical protein